MPSEIDFSRSDTEEQGFNNLLALTADSEVKGTLFASETHDFASLVDGAGETGSIAVVGASLGDIVQVSFSLDLQDQTLTGYVQSTDVVEYRLQNESGGTIDLASGTIKVLVTKMS